MSTSLPFAPLSCRVTPAPSFFWLSAGEERNALKSSAWWKVQSKDLFAITEQGEMGMMQSMVTITHNDRVPELLAAIRRGPFAEPTETDG